MSLDAYGPCYDESADFNLESVRKLDGDIDSLSAVAAEYARIRASVEAKMQRLSPNPPPQLPPTPPTMPNPHWVDSPQGYGDMREIEREPSDPDMKQKERLVSIVELIESPVSSCNLDGLLSLSIFLEDSSDNIHWDGLVLLCADLMRFLPTASGTVAELPDDDTVLIWDATCYCMYQMCQQSQLILERAQRLDAVPRILPLLM